MRWIRYRHLAVALILGGILAGSRPAAAAGDVIRIDAIVDGFGAGHRFVSPRDICCDTLHHEIYVADAGSHRVYIFDDNGWPVYSFVHMVAVRGRRVPGEPEAIAVLPSGDIVLLDALSRYVHLLDYRGRPLTDIDIARLYPDMGDARPQAVGVDAEGRIHVVAAGDDGYQVIILDGEGRSWRRVTLGEPGDLVRVTGMCPRPGGGWVVTDLSAEYAVQVFAADGSRVLQFGKHDIGMENFSYAADVAIARDGSMWVVDMIRQVALHFDPAGHYLTYVGGTGRGIGTMSYPSAVALGGGGRVLVLEKVGRRFQSFVVPEGGGPGT